MLNVLINDIKNLPIFDKLQLIKHSDVCDFEVIWVDFYW